MKHTCWSRWGHKSWLFLCHSCDIRAPPGIQTQQLGLNVDSLETTESSWGQTSVCQSRCIQGNRVNTAANCQVKLKPRPGWCFSVTRKLTLHAGRCQMCSSVCINLFDSLWPLSFMYFYTFLVVKLYQPCIKLLYYLVVNVIDWFTILLPLSNTFIIVKGFIISNYNVLMIKTLFIDTSKIYYCISL